MPSLLDPSLLRGQQPGDDPTGIQTLLAGIGSALSGGVAAPNDPNTSMASFLAAANTLANAGAPTLGPPPTTAQAILGALGNARGAAVETGILPYLQERAQQQLEQQQLDYQIKLFDFQRQYNYMNLLKQGVSAADTSGGKPAVPAAPAAPGGASGDIASLPEVQALPDATRVAAIQVMNENKLTPDQAAHYARILMAESQGLHLDPKTNKVITSPKGATGVAQVMPQTFLDMAQAHDDVTGSMTDLMPNLRAGVHYFADQLAANNGDLRNTTIAYNMGPQGLADYLAGRRTLPAETTDYLARTRAPGVQVADASGRVVGQPGAPAPPGGATGSPDDPLVPDLLNPGLRVPRSVELAAQGAGRGAATNPMAAHAAVIKDYVEKRALAPHYLQAGPPGTQIDVTSNQRVASPPGTETLDAPTPAERQKLFPNVPTWQDILVKRTPDGRIVGHELPNMGEEPIKPISDAQAQKPADEGGAGASYRTGTAYGVGTRSGLVKPIQIERGAGPPLPGAPGEPTVMTPQQQQAADFLASKATSDQRISNFQLQLGYVGRIANLAADPTRTATDDMAALSAFEKFNNPTAVVSREGQDLVLTTGGPEQRVQTVIAKLTGDRILTPDVVQHVIDTVNTETEGARAGFTVASNNYRRQAKARGVDPDLVTPDPDEMVKDYQAQWKASQDRLRGGTGIGGRTAVPGAAPTERAGNLPPVPVPSPAQLGGMTKEGLTALVNDMKANPGRYGAEHRQAIEAEVRRRLQQQPAQGGGG